MSATRLRFAGRAASDGVSSALAAACSALATALRGETLQSAEKDERCAGTALRLRAARAWAW